MKCSSGSTTAPSTGRHRWRAGDISLPSQREVDEAPRRIEFRVVGRDSLTRIPIGEWHGSFLVEPSGAGASRVTIAYRWSFRMNVLASGTIRHQANAAITMTAVALDVLVREYARRAGR